MSKTGIQPSLAELKRGQTSHGLQLSYSYLDDIILAGEQRAISEAYEYLKAKALEIGLHFNTTKCQVIPAAGCNALINKKMFPIDTIFTDDGNFELLGGPIGSSDYCNQHTQSRVAKVEEILFP